ncbi:hypothetical protein [Halomontanus rarus]|uniref:hypothetical protein n=1 Tax=Halomontanus rarus TaxID=3034020 RepID=UPI0023E85253|nr:hypothetical protein [Halovivax sp. TS33]
MSEYLSRDESSESTSRLGPLSSLEGLSDLEDPTRLEDESVGASSVDPRLPDRSWN